MKAEGVTQAAEELDASSKSEGIVEQSCTTVDASAGHSVFQHGGTLRQTAPLCGLTERFLLAGWWRDDIA